MTFAVDVVFCVPTLEAGSTAGHVLRKPVAQWNSLQQASTLKVGESPKGFILTFGEKMSLCQNFQVVSLLQKPVQVEKK